MRINFVALGMRLTGGTRVIAEIINHLAERGHEMRLVTSGTPNDLKWVNLKAKIIFANRNFPQKFFGYLYRQVFGFQSFPEEETRMLLKAMPDSDINVATISYSGFAVDRSNKGAPFHYYMHYEPLVRENGYKKKVIEESYFLPTKKIANSSWLAKMIKEKTGQEVVGLVFPAIDHKIFYAKNKKMMVDKNEKITIAGFSKYKKWKGLVESLMAIKILRDRGYNVEFVTFGNAFNKEMLPPEVRDIDFTFAGSKINESLADFYRSADIYISSSYFESFPLPPLESMACGTPVVTTVFGTEDYAINKQTAMVVQPKNPEQMAEAIIKLIENPNLYRYLSEQGIIAAKKFTWESAAEQMENIFNNLLKRNA